MNYLLQNWVKTVRTNDANQVAELYHDNGLLLGTFSNKERNGKSLILEYFKKLLKSKVDVEIITQHEHKTNTILVSSGLYNFIVNDVIIKARYTFVFSNINLQLARCKAGPSSGQLNFKISRLLHPWFHLHALKTGKRKTNNDDSDDAEKQ